jgi:hypothetical protein
MPKTNKLGFIGVTQTEFLWRATMRSAGFIRIILAVFSLIIFVPMLDAQAQSFSLKGTWNGHYTYEGNQKQVDFTLTLDVDGGTCLGRTKEINTFGDKSAAYLYANVSCLSLGVHPGGSFRFHKQYDGTANIVHEVEYVGTVSPDGNTISGNWLIQSSTIWSTGSFSMSHGQ